MDLNCAGHRLPFGKGIIERIGTGYMKSLWKISRRYVLSAILITVLVLYANIAAFMFLGMKNISSVEENEIGRERMEKISTELIEEDGTYHLSTAGKALLEDSSFIWAMFLDENGDVVWNWQLPGEEFATHYSIGEISAFSKWYLNDYPVRTWKKGEGLMVYGMEKESVVRFDLLYDREVLLAIPDTFKGLAVVNITLLVLLAVFFAWRFYRSIRPIAEGIGELAEKKNTRVPERGLTAELASKLNRASEILKAQDEALERRDMARTEWIAGVSHDIRTPLALITGYADELAREEGIGEEGHRRAEQIQNLSLLIGQLIADLNLTSKLEYQAQPLHKTEYSPAGLLRECVAEYYNQGILNEYEIEVEITTDAEQIRLLGDTGLLLRAFRNLIGNSMRHNPNGCVVSVRLTGTITGAEYFFSDSGSGIPAKVADALGKEMNKASDHLENNSADHPVHIMGLRIVMQIIRAHGGRMEFVPRENGNYDVRLLL